MGDRQMSDKIYRFYVNIEPLRDEMWRVFDVPSDLTLDRLVSLIVTSFKYGELCDYDVEHNDVLYAPQYIVEENSELYRYSGDYILEDLKIEMFSDLGFSFHNDVEDFFNIKLIDVRLPEKDLQYPRVSYGKGQGVINGMDVNELQALIDRIVNCGEPGIKFTDEDGTETYWTYYDYDIEADNEILIPFMNTIKERYDEGDID